MLVSVHFYGCAQVGLPVYENGAGCTVIALAGTALTGDVGLRMPKDVQRASRDDIEIVGDRVDRRAMFNIALKRKPKIPCSVSGTPRLAEACRTIANEPLSGMWHARIGIYWDFKRKPATGATSAPGRSTA